MENEPGNGYHINLYVTDVAGEDVARYAAAGILRHVREITAFLNPTEASYARLGKGNAPALVNWSEKGRSELIYIETYHGQTRVELRSPDASSNPYLVYALLIHAGLEGISQKAELPQEMASDALPLPASLCEARKLAAESAFVKKILPEELIREYTGDTSNQ